MTLGDVVSRRNLALEASISRAKAHPVTTLTQKTN
jgi:hypothetical protein